MTTENESTKDKILTSAKRLFSEKGYQATSLKDIVEEIGKTPGIIYYYFESKEEILVRIYEGIMEEAIEGMSKMVSSDTSTSEKMSEAIRYHAEFIMQKQPYTKILFDEESFLPYDFQKLIRKKKGEYSKLVEDVYADGIREGVFKPTLDLRVLMNAIFGMINWTYRWYSSDKRSDFKKIYEQFVDILTEGYTVVRDKELDLEENLSGIAGNFQALTGNFRALSDEVKVIRGLLQKDVER